jgi:hypothetical protein
VGRGGWPPLALEDGERAQDEPELTTASGRNSMRPRGNTWRREYCDNAVTTRAPHGGVVLSAGPGRVHPEAGDLVLGSSLQFDLKPLPIRNLHQQVALHGAK